MASVLYVTTLLMAVYGTDMLTDEAAPNCKWVGFNYNSTGEMIPPDVCYASHYSTNNSAIYKCIDENSVLYIEYENTLTCDLNNGGMITSQTWYNRSEGWDLNCDPNAIDCSAKSKHWDASCDTKRDQPWQEAIFVTNVCEGDAGGSQMNYCNDTAIWGYGWNNSKCEGTPNNYQITTTGCDLSEYTLIEYCKIPM